MAEMASITALILCGGLGIRLRQVTGALPKVLAPVAGRPFLFHLLRYLAGQGVSDIVLCAGYAAEQVVSCCGDGSQWGVNLRYSSESKPLGTGGAITRAQPLIASDPFLVLNGDSLAQAGLADLIAFHAEKQAQISMVLAEVPDKTRFGSALLGGNDSIVGFSEKGHQGSGLINAGIYLMNCAALEVIPSERNVSIERDIFPRFIGKGLYGRFAAGLFIDIGTPESYSIAQTVLAGCSERAQR